MSNLKNSLSQAGYNQEEAYFFERERELILEMRKKTMEEAKKQTQLTLLQGGKTDTPPQKVHAPSSSAKKAA